MANSSWKFSSRHCLKYVNVFFTETFVSQSNSIFSAKYPRNIAREWSLVENFCFQFLCVCDFSYLHLEWLQKWIWGRVWYALFFVWCVGNWCIGGKRYKHYTFLLHPQHLITILASMTPLEGVVSHASPQLLHLVLCHLLPCFGLLESGLWQHVLFITPKLLLRFFFSYLYLFFLLY